jgi:hypothetical protein
MDPAVASVSTLSGIPPVVGFPAVSIPAIFGVLLQTVKVLTYHKNVTR